MAFIVTVIEVTSNDETEQDGRYQKLGEEYLSAREYAQLEDYNERKKWKMISPESVPQSEAQYSRDVFGYAPPVTKKAEKKEKVFEQQVGYLNLAKLILAVNGLKTAE